MTPQNDVVSLNRNKRITNSSFVFCNKKGITTYLIIDTGKGCRFNPLLSMSNLYIFSCKKPWKKFRGTGFWHCNQITTLHTQDQNKREIWEEQEVFREMIMFSTGWTRKKVQFCTHNEHLPCMCYYKKDDYVRVY